MQWGNKFQVKSVKRRPKSLSSTTSDLSMTLFCGVSEMKSIVITVFENHPKKSHFATLRAKRAMFAFNSKIRYLRPT